MRSCHPVQGWRTLALVSAVPWPPGSGLPLPTSATTLCGKAFLSRRRRRRIPVPPEVQPSPGRGRPMPLRRGAGATMDVGLFEAIYSARSMRRFRPDPVPEEFLTRVLDAAIRAPSAGNAQNWAFVVVGDPAQRRKLGAVYRKT